MGRKLSEDDRRFLLKHAIAWYVHHGRPGQGPDEAERYADWFVATHGANALVDSSISHEVESEMFLRERRDR